jgi:hypothetical protein
VDKQKKTAAKLEEIVKQRIGAGDFRVTIHRNPDAGWHATIYGRQPAEVHRCQVMADTIASELCQHCVPDPLTTTRHVECHRPPGNVSLPCTWP